MSYTIHVIPVGGTEPIHAADRSCWCHPMQDQADRNIVVHNAKDLRDARERLGITENDRPWINVSQPNPMNKKKPTRFQRTMRWLWRPFCSHRAYISNISRRPDGKVECPCNRCGKIMVAEYGLALPCQFEREPE